MPKSPFEKVRSLVERRKLFEGLLAEQTEVLCKGEGDSLFQIKPTLLVADSHIQGFMTGEDSVPQKDMAVLGNFSVGADRFFFKAPMKVLKNDEVSIPLNAEVYRLQRRATLRLHVHSSLGVYLAIKELRGKPVYSIAHIADISAGGARIFFSNLDSPIGATGSVQPLDLKMGDEFKAILHLGDRKTLDVTGLVKHIQQAVYHGQIVDHLGIEFIALNQMMKNRLIAMTMDLQQKLVFAD